MQASSETEVTLDALTLESEPKCQSSHESDDLWYPDLGSVCSIRVVARKILSCENYSFLICVNSYQWNLAVINDPDAYCEGCDRHCSECWKVFPV